MEYKKGHHYDGLLIIYKWANYQHKSASDDTIVGAPAVSNHCWLWIAIRLSISGILSPVLYPSPIFMT